MDNGAGQEAFLPLNRSPESISMLRGLSDRDANNRADIFLQCRSMFQVWYFGLSSPPNMSEMQYLGGAAAAGHCGDPSQRCNIEEQLPELLRIAKLAPLQDAREKAAELLDFVETTLQMRLPRPRYSAEFATSEFIPQRELIPLDQSSTSEHGQTDDSCTASAAWTLKELDDEGNLTDSGSSSHDLDAELIEHSQELLLDQFHEWHRSCNVFHVMAYHPEYLDIFLKFHNCLLRSAGPVGYAERHYLALMAASRHRCAYLAHLHATEFIHLNGDVTWLRGLRYASSKMQKLGHLCRLLAHRPWEITSDSLRPLLTGPDSLSQSELVHSMCILAHFTALAGFVAGTGVRPEIDSPLGHTYRSDSGDFQQQQQQQQQQQFLQSSSGSINGYLAGGLPSSSPTPSSPGIDPNQRVIDLMNAIRDLDDETEAGETLPEEQLIRRFECIEAETAGLPCFHRSVSREQQQQQQQQQMLFRQQQQQLLNAQELIADELANFCEEPGFSYKDFHLAKADDKQLRSFRIQDYSWEEDGCCLVDRYLPSIGCALDERFETSFNLTYGTMGINRNVETAPFRRAVWYYVHSIFGMRHDDYDYNLINRMLTIELKKYCKSVACAPEQVTKEHYQSAMPGFKHSEKVHVNLVIMDARVQACLLYSLRALNDHTSGQ